jgi:small-conductance mechanosensitive channel
VLRHEDVLDQPQPIILFKDFGDNSLMFEAHFWLHMRTVMQGEKVASDIRLSIDQLFADAHITIAFPQRDVHLDTLSPIEVNVRQLLQGEVGSLSRVDAA